jgi:hypothetical protein
MRATFMALNGQSKILTLNAPSRFQRLTDIG